MLTASRPLQADPNDAILGLEWGLKITYRRVVENTWGRCNQYKLYYKQWNVTLNVLEHN